MKALRELSKKDEAIYAPDTSIFEFQLVLRGLNKKPSEVKLALLSLKQVFEENSIEEVKTIGIATLILQYEFEEKYGLSYFDSLVAASSFVLDRVVVSNDRAFNKIPDLRRIAIE